jgi:membrane protease YdiL (CAAX protease family)
MTQSNNRTMHPLLQFLVLTSITVGLIFVGALLGLAVAAAIFGLAPVMDLYHNGISFNNVNVVWVLQIVSTTIPLFAGPYIFATYVMKEPREYLKATIKISPALLLIVLGIMLFSMPLMEWLIVVNQKMILPSFLKGVEEWMKRSEAEATKETAILLQLKTLGQMLFALLIVGLCTAIAEEFLFRGCIQTIFTRLTKNVHAGIWITAILFSAMHMQFYGFLPRMALGVFFGYFAAWSGSIWPAVCGHFINNGMAVVATYLYQQKKIAVNPDANHVFNYQLYAASVVITVFLLLIYRNAASARKHLPEY